MGKKFEELKSLVNAFGGTVEPTDDTVADLICKLVKVACKSYEIKATCIDGVWSIDTPYSEIQEAVENGECVYIKSELSTGTYEIYQWVSYVNKDSLRCMVFSRTECLDNEMWCKTLYLYSDNSTEYYMTDIISE